MVQLLFFGSEKSKTEEHELKCFYNSLNEIYISINLHQGMEHFICLDKHTSIKFSRELRKQIALIQDEESI